MPKFTLSVIRAGEPVAKLGSDEPDAPNQLAFDRLRDLDDIKVSTLHNGTVVIASEHQIVGLGHDGSMWMLKNLDSKSGVDTVKETGAGVTELKCDHDELTLLELALQNLPVAKNGARKRSHERLLRAVARKKKDVAPVAPEPPGTRTDPDMTAHQAPPPSADPGVQA